MIGMAWREPFSCFPDSVGEARPGKVRGHESPETPTLEEKGSKVFSLSLSGFPTKPNNRF